MLAPLLLLLNQDPVLLRGLGDRQRYAPPVGAVVAYLTAASALELYTRTFVGQRSLFNAHEKTAFFFFKNLVALLLALPNHVNFVRVRPPSPCTFLSAIFLRAPTRLQFPSTFLRFAHTCEIQFAFRRSGHTGGISTRIHEIWAQWWNRSCILSASFSCDCLKLVLPLREGQSSEAWRFPACMWAVGHA